MTRLGLLREGQAGQEEVALYKESRAEGLGACSGESVVGTKIGLVWNTEGSGGLALPVGESALARIGPLSLTLS